MPQLCFVPARNSRHRVAAIALLRALLREGRQVQLPQDVCRKGRHPVSDLIKKAFHRNRTEVSPRLIFAAMTAGYKFLTFFKNAQSQASTEHSEIVAYLREKNEQIAQAEANQRPKKKPRRPKRIARPLIERVSEPGRPPEFVSNFFPRPRHVFKGRRKIPQVVVTASGDAFLRYKRPQPVTLSKILRRKAARKHRLSELSTTEFENELLPQAMDEDMWEELVDEMLGVRRRRRGDRNGHEQTARDCRAAVQAALRTHRADNAVKAQVLYKAVEEEKKLLAEEIEEAKRYGVRIVPTEAEKLRPYLEHRRRRRAKRGADRRRKKVNKWRNLFVGLWPAPIQVRKD
ncbi:hypothetical protein CTRI78_v011168 [Colletotrichum trifolii]|uniref:DNA repair protein n=1 Tax=Colletotrichum trifolii TaxID=5466 RepID=A0A4R8QEC4_COLTR|nr:hypothetical protein CTRI78_v011168 [Colletotrichum trifolii]